MSRKSLKPNFNIMGEVIEIKVMNGGRTIFKDRCEIKNKKKLKKIGEVLKYKFDISLEINKKLNKKYWFD